MKEKFERALAAAGVRLGETPLVLMVSGGSDSTALAYLAADVLALACAPAGAAAGSQAAQAGAAAQGLTAGAATQGTVADTPATAGAAPAGSQAAQAAQAAGAAAQGLTAGTATQGLTAAGTLGILHVNHELRGEAADADERFVEKLALHLGIPFYCYRVDVADMARREGGNVEAIGRRERYAAAYEVLADLHAQATAPAAHDARAQLEAAPAGESGFILTAHTQDDRVENFYMRSIVGTGPGGFRGMARQNGCVLHPLLDCSREELRSYIRQRAALATAYAEGEGAALAASDAESESAALAAANDKGQRAPLAAANAEGERAPLAAANAEGEGAPLWCEDATNAETDHFRTFVRHEIVPRAKAQNPRLLDTLSRSMDLIADEDDYLEACACALLRAHVGWSNPLGPDWFSQRMGGILPDTQLAVVEEGAPATPDYSAGCVLAPRFAEEPLVLQRRAVFRVLQLILGEDARVETASVEAVLDTLGRSGAVVNIQGNLAVSTNKRGTRIEPMEAYRARRKRF